MSERDRDHEEAHLYPVRVREYCHAADLLRRTPRAIVSDAVQRARPVSKVRIVRVGGWDPNEPRANDPTLPP